MSHLPFTLLAYLLNSIAVTVDKFLITRHISDPILYIFYFSVVSLLALLLLPFTHIPTLSVFLLASTSTILWTSGAYFMFKALQIGLVSRVIPMIGTLIPIILLINALFKRTISTNETLAVFILVLGLVFLTLPDWKGKIKRSELIFTFLSALLFALSYAVLRQAYLKTDFLAVFVWSRPILVLLGIIILITPKLRNKIFGGSNAPKVNFFSRIGVIFVAGSVAGGIAELLLTFSVSLADPALVNSLQGSQYVFLLIFSLTLAKIFPDVFREKYTKLSLLGKVTGIVFITLGLFILAI